MLATGLGIQMETRRQSWKGFDAFHQDKVTGTKNVEKSISNALQWPFSTFTIARGDKKKEPGIFRIKQKKKN